MRDLLLNELDEVNGGFLNFIIGGVVGAATYMLYACMTDDFEWGELAGATVAGAVTNGFSALAGGGAATAAYFGVVGTAAGAATDNAVTGYMDLVR